MLQFKQYCNSMATLQRLPFIQIPFRMLFIQPKSLFKHIDQFQVIQHHKIGCGSFGTVRLARHKNTCRMYALKIINLADIPSDSEVKLVEREISIHKQLDHPHIIKLWHTLVDEQRIHMIMQYADGGNLFYHQNSKTVFSEAEAFKFFTQTLEGIQYLHSNDIIHRDIKPENLLLDASNNIKICDFGWCAQDIHAKRTTFCGTYEYMAPEMIFKTEYDYRVDIWAMGVLLYEMLHGNAPFKGKNSSEVQQSMLRGVIEFAPELSQNLKDLIQSILQFEVQKRLSIEQIFQHPWIKSMSNYVNNYLKLQNIVFPKDIHAVISMIPQLKINSNIKLGSQSKHRKNNSLNYDESSRNINISLEINNYAYPSKPVKLKNNYHSQEKQPVMDFPTKKDGSQLACNQSTIKKSKMEPILRTQISELNIYRSFDKIKSNKQQRLKDIIRADKQKKDKDKEKDKQTGQIKKKVKLRKSEVGLNNDKYPVRFNTQFFDKQEQYQPKLKKSHLKSKLMGSKGNLKLYKNKD